MTKIERDIRILGGIAAMGELLRLGNDARQVMLFAEYGLIRRIRKGWYATLDVGDDVVRAHRVGGRLACFSALAHYGYFGSGESPPGSLHVAVPRSSSRLRSADLPGRRLDESANVGVVVHWNRTASTVDRQAVPLAEAIAQARTCAGRATQYSAESAARVTL